MPGKPSRVVVAIYSSSEEAARAYRSVRSSAAKIESLLLASEGAPGARSRLSRYAPPLAGEDAVLVAAPSSDIQSIVKTLRGAGEPSIFMLTEHVPEPPAVRDSPAPASIAEIARQCADRRSASPLSKNQILARVRDSETRLDAVHRSLAEASRLDHTLTASAEWLLDNGYLIRTAIADIRRSLPSDRHHIHARQYGYLFVSELAAELVRYSDRCLDESNIAQALVEYQRWTPLSIAELWSFPLLLRLSVIESLSALVQRVDRAQQLREAGYFWANRLAAGARRDDQAFERTLQQLESESVGAEPYFATSLIEQLQDEDRALAPTQQWVETKLGMPLSEVVRAEHNREAAERVSIANAFGSLRTLARLDFTKSFEATSLVEAELSTDATHAGSDFVTRDRARKIVEEIARHSATGELEVARRAIALAQRAQGPAGSVSYFLLDEGIAELERKTGARMPLRTRTIRALRHNATPFYLTGTIGLTAWFLALALTVAWAVGVRQPLMLTILGTLALFPLSELAIQIVNALVISLLPPDPLPKMDFKEGIPPEHTTLVVVPMMLTSTDVVRQEIEKLEVRFLANQEANIFYSLFPDFTDSQEVNAFGDTDVLAAARQGIEQLNARYPGNRFLLFHRPRVWSESERRWIGRERKRGKLEDLNAFLCCEGDPSILCVGELPHSIPYVITLDADTQLPPDTARRMIETVAHPLNRVVLDPVTRVRTRGFTIIQPRVSISLPGATATHFTRVFADTSGTDPYCQTVSDAQQDLFGEAIFHGKAIYDVRSFRDSVGHRFPSETLLSHDLIEGAYVGVGLASDIELFENMPFDYATYSKRQHRWIRGDWQIAPWMLPLVPAANSSLERNPLSVINRWRIFDNLRRSLVPSASLVLLLFGWLTLKAPAVWSLVVGLAIAIPAVAPLFERFARYLQGSIRGWRGAFDELIRAAVMVAFLPHQAWLSIDAICRVTYRRWISRHHLLEWQTAESASLAHSHFTSTMRQMLMVSGCSLILMIVMRIQSVFAPTALFLILWALSPLLMQWLARPVRNHSRRRFQRANSAFLRTLARRTWRFFDDLVGPAMNWLPPDNTQLSLHIEVAPRTSPTNIGFWLTSALAARDFGYLTADDFCRRCTQTLDTLDRLEHYEGHILNWYDIQSLKPLEPRYVSTADSGNLIACLWVLEQGCHDAIRAPALGQQCMRGLIDTLSILQQSCGPATLASVHLGTLQRLLRGKAEGHALIGRLRLAVAPLQQLREIERGAEPAYWASRLEYELRSWIETVELYLKWMETLMRPPEETVQILGSHVARLRRRAVRAIPSLHALASGHSGPVDEILTRRLDPALPSEVAGWLNQLATEYQEARTNAARSVANLQRLAASAERLSSGMNMRFLYDRRRRLFGIGYAVGTPVEFTSHYDLLASEARLASLVAMAKGDVPVEHWFALGRPRTASTLLSWSGTAFEYLMPVLFTRMFANSLLENACNDAIHRQIDYGDHLKVPWGISESAYSALDANQTYQYQAFGVPQLALKPGLEEEGLVISPYSTMLALPIQPAAALENLKHLEEFGLLGPMGLYEAIDFTRAAERHGQRGVVIYSYMAHHQGMSLLALDNTLYRGIMQRRFHTDLRIRAVESVLFERIPLTHAALEKNAAVAPQIRPVTAEESAERIWTEATLVPRVHFYGNGRYSLMVTNSGGGYSRWNDLDLTRWRSDTTLDPWGGFLYIRDTRSDALWSATPKPVNGNQGSCSVHFSADRAEFHRNAFGIESVLEVTVAPEDDVELRRLTVTNRSVRSRLLEFTSYSELALAPHAADKAHPAFSKMFIETERTADNILIAQRRPRSPEEPHVWAAHLIVGASGQIQSETDRAKFLGRGNGVEFADALRRPLTGATGIVLDPIFSLRCRATIEPVSQFEFVLVTIIANSREDLLALAAKYRRAESVGRAFEMAWTRSQLEFRYLSIGPAKAHRFLELASNLVYPNPFLRLPAVRMERNRLGQSALWGYGISGDLPMLTVIVGDPRGMPLVRELLLAHTYWLMRGFRADLIILNQESPSYDLPLHHQLQRLIDAYSQTPGTDHRGSVYLRDWHAMPENHRDLLLCASAVVLSGSRGSLQQQLAIAGKALEPPPFVRSGTAAEEPSVPLPFLELPYFNGLGGFTQDAREYAIYLSPKDKTPAPWANVMANSQFGALVTESGLGCTWRTNSQTNRLTPWHNDPVTDPQSEIIYLRDDDSGACWTPTPQTIRENDAYRARHGQGYTVFEHNSHAIGQELTVFVPLNDNGSGDPVKVCRLRLRNDSSRRRRLTVLYFAEWVLGSSREDQLPHIQTTYDHDSGAICARQSWNGSQTNQLAFAASTPRATSHSADRTSILGRNRSTTNPAALERARLDNRTGAGLDPAAALQLEITLDRGAHTEVVFLLGEAATIEEVRDILSRYRTSEQVDRALTTTRNSWDATLGALQVRTPILSTDFLLNRWLPYQVLSCRFWGRTAFYQSSGAFGFRDQLQDCLAFVYARPEFTRAHILRAAARQFNEGDVQHWWHPDTGMGVRTLCSDDLLWLPFVVAQYVNVTGDRQILDEPVAFLEGEPLKPNEHERLFVPPVSAHTSPLWDHCRRAIDRAWRLGAHGLPLFGSGDWNDGMNLVGIEGRGESVWLAWFLCAVVDSFAPWMAQKDPHPAADWRARAALLKDAAEATSWDGDWYLRGFFDNGTPLGSHANSEARIDSIAQSWAVIANAEPARTRRALESTDRLLVDDTNKLVRLFTPPFDRSTPHPGYIMGYPPGLRENGGQYTHGALWTAMAWARLGDGAAAVRLLTMMNPVEHTRTPHKVAHYRGEPYSAAADVTSAQGRAGQSGWTWYTGSAAWMYRIWIEEVLGFHLHGNRLTLRPVIPDDWPGFEITYRYRSATYHITVQKDPSLAVPAPEFLHLDDDGATHRVHIGIPRKAASQLQSNNGVVHSGPASQKGTNAMNWDQIEGKWKQLKGSAKQQWGKLTDDDLDYISGSKDKLVGRLQERYGIKKEDAQTRANEWLDTVPTMPEETSTRR